jgi:hypothetical protein
VLEIESSLESSGHSLVAYLAGTSGRSVTWRVDGREVKPAAIPREQMATIRTIHIDTSVVVVVELLTEREGAVDGEIEIRVVRSIDSVVDRQGRRAPTMFLLGSILVSGDDLGAIGGRRQALEQRIEQVNIVSPATMSQRVGATVPFSFVEAKLSVDPRPYLFGNRR